MISRQGIFSENFDFNKGQKKNIEINDEKWAVDLVKDFLRNDPSASEFKIYLKILFLKPWSSNLKVQQNCLIFMKREINWLYDFIKTRKFNNFVNSSCLLEPVGTKLPDNRRIRHIKACSASNFVAFSGSFVYKLYIIHDI